MKVIFRHDGTIIGTASDAYWGPELFAYAPAGFTAESMADWRVVDGAIVYDLQAVVMREAQKRLDAFAQTRTYDGIMSACTYATSSVAKFQAEGQYCVNARDAMWSALGSLLADVQAGTRPAPASWAEVEALLPPLAWPA